MRRLQAGDNLQGGALANPNDCVTETGTAAPIDPDEQKSKRAKLRASTPDCQDRFERRHEVTARVQVAHVESIKAATTRRLISGFDFGVPVDKGWTHAQRDHCQALGIKRVGNCDLPTGKLGISNDRLGGKGAPTVEGPAQDIPMVRIPLRVSGVAAVVNR